MCNMSEKRMPIFHVFLQGFTTSQLAQLEENNEMISQREKEIQNIVKSIFDLNEIFKDLAVMIIDQVWMTES